MQDYKLKLILTILSSLVFAFVFVLLAFVSPIKKEQNLDHLKKPKSLLEKVSHAAKK